MQSQPTGMRWEPFEPRSPNAGAGHSADASKRRSHLGSNGEAGGRLAPKASNPSSLAQPAFRRQAPEVRAVCIKCTYGSVRGARGNSRSYRDQTISVDRGREAEKAVVLQHYLSGSGTARCRLSVRWSGLNLKRWRAGRCVAGFADVFTGEGLTHGIVETPNAQEAAA
jgi:hypothetical protein